jgi:hypothetical protein
VEGGKAVLLALLRVQFVSNVSIGDAQHMCKAMLLFIKVFSSWQDWTADRPAVSAFLPWKFKAQLFRNTERTKDSAAVLEHRLKSILKFWGTPCRPCA